MRVLSRSKRRGGEAGARRASGSNGSLIRGAVRYAVISLVPVALLGVALTGSYNREAERRGLAEGRSEALIVAQTGVEPFLDGRPLAAGLSPAELDSVQRLVRRAVWTKDILRLRMRDLSGRVVFSDDGSGLTDRPEDEALRAAAGQTVALLTRINTDRNDEGAIGPSAVEVYLPVVAGQPATQVGVLELYLPYAPIRQDVASGMHMLYLDLSLGLGLLWLVLLAISWSLSLGLRRQVRLTAYIAEHDALTGLPNRVLFHRRGEMALADARGRRVAMAIVDLDRFKEVNDTLGHHNGDRLLEELAVRLSAHIRPGDIVARLGGDEFGVILVDADDPSAVLGELRQLIVDELEVDGLPLSVEASIGFVVAPDDGDDVDTLLQRADVAMYVAKSQHAGVVHYDAGLDHYDARNLQLVTELRHAIDAQQLVLHYQPKTNLTDGTVRAVEALVRWQHPTFGLLPPDRFLPLAEQTEIIDRLTVWVLEQAVADINALGDAELSVAVNVSARNLARPDFADTVLGIVEQGALSPSRLILEITETALLQDPARAARGLAALAAGGVRISLDDFGCGQTSLGYLSALPVHELKIDKSFVSDMLSNSAHGAIVRSIVDLGHNLAMSVVGEGVETHDVLAGLRGTGCDIAQGFYFARPMPYAELARWLSSRAAADAAAQPSEREPVHAH